MFSTGKRIAALAMDAARLRLALQELRTRVDKAEAQLAVSTPAALAAQLDDLRAAIDIQRAAARKELGALWGRLGGKPAAAATNNFSNADFSAAPTNDFQALLELQSSPPVKPQ